MYDSLLPHIVQYTPFSVQWQRYLLQAIAWTGLQWKMLATDPMPDL